jgi:hypothetical protein
MRTLFDTSVLVPAVTEQLGNHEAALDALFRYRLTYNVRHFERFQLPGVVVTTP